VFFNAHIPLATLFFWQRNVNVTDYYMAWALFWQELVCQFGLACRRAGKKITPDSRVKEIDLEVSHFGTSISLPSMLPGGGYLTNNNL
jgi:hypothetical protein